LDWIGSKGTEIKFEFILQLLVQTSESVE